MHISPEFEDRLHDWFDGRFRVRWSEKTHQVVLEQRVATGQLMEPPPVDPDAETIRWDTYDDNYIRARDGYFYVMTITPGDRMECPVCHATLPVPVFETREVKCEYCIRRGRDGRYAAAHFALDDRFLEHIRYLDPMSDGPKRAHQRVKANRERNTAQVEFQRNLDEADYRVQFNKNQAENNPMVGYGPKHRQVDGDRLIGA